MYAQTIYESKTKLPITKAEMSALRDRSLQNNLDNGLTGFLYYNDWQFLHVLEGRPAQVANTMQRISNDPMHGNFKIRLMNRCSNREFPEWPFGIVHEDDFELRRVVKNMGYKSLIRANVLDILKVLKRTAGRKFRTLNVLEKQMLRTPNSMGGSLKLHGANKRSVDLRA